MSEKRIDAVEWRGLVVDAENDTDVLFGTATGETVTIRIPPTAAYEMIAGLISALGTVHRSRSGHHAMIAVHGWTMERPLPPLRSTIVHVHTEGGPLLTLGVGPEQLEGLEQLARTRLQELERMPPEPPPGSTSRH